MGAPKNFYNTVDQRKLGIDEIPAIKAKVDSLEGLPEVTTSDNGKILGVVGGEWKKTFGDYCPITIINGVAQIPGRYPPDTVAQNIFDGKSNYTFFGSSHEIYIPTIAEGGEDYHLRLEHIDAENKVCKVCDFIYTDANKLRGTYTEIPFEAPGGTGDIDWERELIDEWDFTQSLESKNGIVFTIEDPSKASRTSSGLISTHGESRVYADLSSLGITDWNEIDIELDCDVSEFNPNQDKQIFAFYNTGFSNYSLGPKWAGNDGFYGFMANNHSALYKVNQPKFFESLCTKIEYDDVNSKDMCTYYGRGVILTPIVNPEFGSKINDAFQGANKRIYLGSGYSDWTITGLMMKSLRIYRRTGGET